MFLGIFQCIHEKHERQIFSYIQTQNKNINTQSRCSKMLKVMRTSWQKKPQTFHSNFKAARCRRQTPHPPIPLITLQCATTACLGPKFSFCLFVFVLSCGWFSWLLCEKSWNSDTLGPVELIVWPEQGNQGPGWLAWTRWLGWGIYHHIWNE